MNQEHGAITFTLEKMSVIHENPVEYFLEAEIGGVAQKISMNAFLGKTLSLTHTGLIHCLYCGKKTKKSFSQGACYVCFTKKAACDMCILKPETCHYAQGTCREPEWGDTHCNIDHVVYLANSSGIKVGITRATQIPVRWIDQGAGTAVPLYKVKTRHISGLLEVEIKKFVTDKTNWQKMLKGEEEPLDLLAERERIWTLVADTADKLSAIKMTDEFVRQFRYPVTEYPKKVASHSFEKTPTVKGVLKGIKGQYLIFDNGVINLRKYGGFQITLE